MANTSHIARSAEATFCGKPFRTRRVHMDWPICKVCLRAHAATGGRVRVEFDEDGWAVAHGEGRFVFVIETVVQRKAS